MKKRLVALLLVAVMVLSITACGSSSSPKTVDDAVNQLTSFEVKQADIDLTLTKNDSTGDESNVAKIIIVNMDEKNAVFDVQYKMDGGEYMPVTTMFTSDSTIYINATQLLNFITTLVPSYSMLKSYIKLTNDYVMITKEELLSYLSDYGVDSSSLDFSETAESTARLKELNKMFFNIMKDASEKSGTSFLSVKDGALKIEITPDNIEKILTALADIDYAKYVDQLGDATLSGKKDEYNQTFKDAIQEFQSSLKSESLKVNLTSTAKTEGASGDKKANITMNGKITDDTNTMKIDMNMICSEKASKTYTIPTNAEPLSQLLSSLSKLGFQ